MDASYATITLNQREITYLARYSVSRVVSFISRIDFGSEADSCWKWRGCVYGPDQAYGVFYHHGQNIAAHRYAWMVLRGDIPKGKHLHHKCGQTLCVNPDHLEPVDPSLHATELSKTNITYINKHLTHCRRGHPLTGDNLYVYPGGGKRRCLTCFKEWQQKRQERAAVHRIVVRKPQTHCKRGHEMTPENVYMWRGHRYCKACHNDLTLRVYHERKPKNPKPPRTHCKFGHELTPENTLEYTNPYSGGMIRKCRTCEAAYKRARRSVKSEVSA